MSSAILSEYLFPGLGELEKEGRPVVVPLEEADEGPKGHEGVG